ncbi:hypothetical protein JCM3765_001240 [Sporobolomyces pararoseus]
MTNISPGAGIRDAMILLGQQLVGGQLANWNLSETIGIKRMLQIPLLGTLNNDVSSKLYKPDSNTRDLHPEDKAERRRVYELFMKHCEGDPALKSMNWTLVLFKYEISHGSGRFVLDWGQMVFVDNTATRWILVNCYGDRKCNCCNNPLENDYEEIMRTQSLRFLNALSYLPSLPKVQWVRSTFTTKHYPQLHPLIFDFSKTTSISVLNGVPPLLHFTPSALEPGFTETDLLRIDSFLKAFGFQPPNDTIKQKVLVPERLAHLPHPGKPVAPRTLSPVMNQPVKRECQGCGRPFGFDALKYCTGCYGVLFCSSECQKRNWKVHKLVCVPRSS